MPKGVLAHQLTRGFGLSGSDAAAARATLRRLIAGRGVGAVAAGLGGAPAEAVGRWAGTGVLPGPVRRAMGRLAADWDAA